MLVMHSYVRFDPRQPWVPPQYHPLSAGHRALDRPGHSDWFRCPGCSRLFEAGDVTTLMPLGPGGDGQNRASARVGRVYSAVAILMHYSCATGEETLAEAIKNDVENGAQGP